MRPFVGLVLALMAGTCGCSNKLDKETAEKALQNELGAVSCSFFLQQKTDTEWVYLPYNEIESACVAQLQAEGLATVGACLEKGCSADGCCNKVLLPTAKSRISKDDSGLAFPCGTNKLIGVTSIVTENNKATVKYEREVTFDKDLLSRLKSCQLKKVDEGKKERERGFVRDDSGNWRPR